MIQGAIFRHYKGNDYIVLDVGTHTETGEQYVIYHAFQDPNSKIWLRPYDMFFGTVVIDGIEQKRFKQLL